MFSKILILEPKLSGLKPEPILSYYLLVLMVLIQAFSNFPVCVVAVTRDNLQILK